MTAATVSLVVCTHNRGQRLGPFLAHLAELRLPGYSEIIIVDSASTDETPTILAQAQALARWPGKLLRVPIRGLGRARNTGWLAARGDIVAFTDDDCYVSPNLLECYLQVFAEHERVGCVGGRVLLHDPQDARITIKESADPVILPPGAFVPPGFVLGANFAFRRDALANEGGFDPELGAGTRFPCEDVDMAARCSAAGWAVMYDPRPVVRHHHGRRTVEEVRSLRAGYDAGRGAYMMKALLDPRRRVKYGRRFLTRLRSESPRLWYPDIVAGWRYLMRRWLA
jgi:glycosyltransferase involved in cell wall biosynthesis